jgi:hypothetical protein
MRVGLHQFQSRARIGRVSPLDEVVRDRHCWWVRQEIKVCVGIQDVGSINGRNRYDG